MSDSPRNEQGHVHDDPVSFSSRHVSKGNEDAEVTASDQLWQKSLDEEENLDEYFHDELKREEPLDSTFDKSRGFEAKPDLQQHRQLLRDPRASFSMSDTNAAEDEDAAAKNIMEEKRIAGEELPETGIDQPKEGEEAQHLKPLDKKRQSEGKEQSDEDEDEDEDDDQDSHQIPAEGLYDPNEFINLPVGSDVKELFQFISAYTPQVIEIDTTLKPFILDYIPSVGDVDAFIKVPRPDDVEDNLGLLVLDEPCAKQSDPTVLDLHLRAASKDALPKGTVVKKLARADRNPKEIENWIKSIGDLHKSKPATQVHYSKPMPDIDVLMQEWPPEVEDTLKQIDLPSADLEQMPLEQYVDTACALLDIPIYKSRIQSLHVLFTLYSEFKNSQHFRALAEENKLENATNGRRASNTDRLVL